MPIVLNKFRLGDRSERIAALADEWGCSVTVATARLLDAGLAAVDREQRMTPDAIRAAFELQASGRMLRHIQHIQPGQIVDVPSPSRFYSKEALEQAIHSYDGPGKLTVASNGDLVGEISMEAIEAAADLMAPSIPDLPGKRMFDEAARHAVDGASFWTAAPSSVGWPGCDDELCADESCPGCGCLPGDGVTDGCTHPDGCGFYEGDATE